MKNKTENKTGDPVNEKLFHETEKEMEEFEKLLYSNVGAALSVQEEKAIRIDIFTRSYHRWLFGILLIFLGEGLLVYHRLLHGVLLLGAFCLMRELKRCENAGKGLAFVRWAWLVALSVVITYDSIAFLNYPYPWRQFCMKNYAYRKLELSIVGGFLLLTLWSLSQTMSMMAGKENKGRRQSDSRRVQAPCAPENEQEKRDNWKTPESRKWEIWCATGWLVAAAIALIIFAIFPNTSFWKMVILLLLLWQGVKRMNAVERKICYGDGRRQYFRKFRPAEWIAMVFVFAAVAAAVGIAMADPYLTGKTQIGYITEESRWLACRDFLVNTLQEETFGHFESMLQIEEQAARIRTQLENKGVDKEVLNDLLASDVLRLENTERVWKNSHICELFPNGDQTDVRYRQNNAQGSVTAVVDSYIFENDSDPHEYQILYYVRFTGQKELTNVCDRIQMNDSLMEAESSVAYNNPLEAWIFKSDVGNKTVCYQGKWQQRSYGFAGCETALPEGENFRAYRLGSLVNVSDHQSDDSQKVKDTQQAENAQQGENAQQAENAQQVENPQQDDKTDAVIALWLRIKIYQTQDYYDEIKNQMSYEIVRGTINDGQAGFMLRFHDGQIVSVVE